MENNVDIIIGLGFGVMLGLLVGGSLVGEAYREEAVERGYALYCPNNGNFSWVGDCDIGE